MCVLIVSRSNLFAVWRWAWGQRSQHLVRARCSKAVHRLRKLIDGMHYSERAYRLQTWLERRFDRGTAKVRASSTRGPSTAWNWWGALSIVRSDFQRSPPRKSLFQRTCSAQNSYRQVSMVIGGRARRRGCCPRGIRAPSRIWKLAAMHAGTVMAASRMSLSRSKAAFSFHVWQRQMLRRPPCRN